MISFLATLLKEHANFSRFWTNYQFVHDVLKIHAQKYMTPKPWIPETKTFPLWCNKPLESGCISISYYCAAIRSEYSKIYGQWKYIEIIQRRALKIIYPKYEYDTASGASGLKTLTLLEMAVLWSRDY